MIAPCTIRPRKMEKAESPIAPRPQSRLKTSQRRAFECDFKRPCRERQRTIASYEALLKKWREPVGPESVLLFPKDLIAAAISQELMDNPTGDRRTDLEVAYVQLESFIPDQKYWIISEFKNACALAQELAATGRPDYIVAAARLLKKAKCDSAVQIQERILQKMQGRLEQIRSDARKIGWRSRGRGRDRDGL
jgi:hypothetical protein